MHSRTTGVSRGDEGVHFTSVAVRSLWQLDPGLGGGGKEWGRGNGPGSKHFLSGAFFPCQAVTESSETKETRVRLRGVHEAVTITRTTYYSDNRPPEQHVKTSQRQLSQDEIRERGLEARVRRWGHDLRRTLGRGWGAPTSCGCVCAGTRAVRSERGGGWGYRPGGCPCHHCEPDGNTARAGGPRLGLLRGTAVRRPAELFLRVYP